MTLRALLVLIAITSSAHADAPRDWAFRASPGFGYAWDGADSCGMAGRMFVGGFALEHEVAEGLLVGGAMTILFNTLLPDAPCGADGLRLAMGSVSGPALEWYPDPERGLQVFALAGYAELDPAMGEMRGLARGVGGTLGVGWDVRRGDVLLGVRLQVTLARTWTGAADHHAMMPGLVMTIGAD